MQMEQILKLVETMSNSTLSSFRYEENGSCLVLQQQIQKPTEGETRQRITIDHKETLEKVSVPDASQEGKGVAVVSPLVGVFYAQPSEGAEPFIKVGDTVKKGQVIGIIEAMKLMNEVEAPCDGKILEILVENEQMVEYGQEIARIG